MSNETQHFSGTAGKLRQLFRAAEYLRIIGISLLLNWHFTLCHYFIRIIANLTFFDTRNFGFRIANGIFGFEQQAFLINFSLEIHRVNFFYRLSLQCYT